MVEAVQVQLDRESSSPQVDILRQLDFFPWKLHYTSCTCHGVNHLLAHQVDGLFDGSNVVSGLGNVQSGVSTLVEHSQYHIQHLIFKKRLPSWLKASSIAWTFCELEDGSKLSLVGMQLDAAAFEDQAADLLEQGVAVSDVRVGNAQ